MQPIPPPPDARRLKVLLAGYGHLGLAILQGLLDCKARCDIVGVYRWVSTANGNDYWDHIEADFKALVDVQSLQDLVCPGMNHYEFTGILQSLKPDVVLVGSWGEILKPHLLKRSHPLFINCHPSKLPAHRGANPYASAILADEKESGVTFHQMVPKIDAGPILYQRIIPLDEHETGETLRLKCANLARQMTTEVVERLAAHFVDGLALDLQEQDTTLQSYYPPPRAGDALICWEKSAVDLYRQCRALYPWMSCYSYLEGRREVRLYSPRFVSIASPTQQHEAGTILSFHRGILTIALSQPEWVLEVPFWQFVGKMGPLPFWLSRLLGYFYFKPGKRFRSFNIP
jgi:methionyl-tRNA formyltransferase